jgi:hypothetical protein
MNWLLKLIFPGTRTGVRINPNHLPGLVAPKPAPFTPRLEKPEDKSEENIKDLYKRFIASGGKPATSRKKKDRGVGF